MADDGTGTPPPLEPFDPEMHVAPVIDLAGYRIQAGRNTVPRHQRCEHKDLVYSRDDRRVWCAACNGPVEPFDALLSVLRGFEDMMRAAQLQQNKAYEGQKAVLVRRAAKALDLVWGRKRAPCCPHCRHGLLPEDFEDGARSTYDREYEIARRKRDAVERPDG